MVKNVLIKKTHTHNKKIKAAEKHDSRAFSNYTAKCWCLDGITSKNKPKSVAHCILSTDDIFYGMNWERSFIPVKSVTSICLHVGILYVLFVFVMDFWTWFVYDLLLLFYYYWSFKSAHLFVVFPIGLPYWIFHILCYFNRLWSICTTCVCGGKAIYGHARDHLCYFGTHIFARTFGLKNL